MSMHHDAARLDMKLGYNSRQIAFTIFVFLSVVWVSLLWDPRHWRPRSV